MTQPFPKSPTFLTIDEPFRFEGELFDLEVEGQIPAELDGTARAARRAKSGSRGLMPR